MCEETFLQRTSADDAPPHEGPVVALVADSNQGRLPHVGIAYRAPVGTFFAELADVHAGLLAAHDQIGMMLRHDY